MNASVDWQRRPPSQRPPPAPALPAVCGPLAALNDAVAVLSRPEGRIRWRSAAWLASLPVTAPADDLAALDAVLPGVAAAAAETAAEAAASAEAMAEGTPEAGARLVEPAGRWQIAIVAVDADHWLLRATPVSSGAAAAAPAATATEPATPAPADADLHRELQCQLQRQLDDRERLVFTSGVFSVGEMATTLAHELNQPIGATANLLRGLRLRLGRRKPALADDERDALDRAVEQVMFAARIITRIREFTRRHQPRFVDIDLVALARQSASLLDWDLRRSRVRLALDLPATPVLVHGDAVMLQQVLVNLIRNALDALRAALPPDPRITLQLVAAGAEVELRVGDNGGGLDDEAAARLFVPFASSKPNGMGIGLSICRSFIELHRGRLWYTRNPSGGATFHIGLPPRERSTATSGSSP